MEDRTTQGRLTATRFTDEAQRFARVDVDGYAINSLDDAPFCVSSNHPLNKAAASKIEMDLEVANLDKWSFTTDRRWRDIGVSDEFVRTHICCPIRFSLSGDARHSSLMRSASLVRNTLLLPTHSTTERERQRPISTKPSAQSTLKSVAGAPVL
jgi:hypothetical protein